MAVAFAHVTRSPQGATQQQCVPQASPQADRSPVASPEHWVEAQHSDDGDDEGRPTRVLAPAHEPELDDYRKLLWAPCGHLLLRRCPHGIYMHGRHWHATMLGFRRCGPLRTQHGIRRKSSDTDPVPHATCGTKWTLQECDDAEAIAYTEWKCGSEPLINSYQVSFTI